MMSSTRGEVRVSEKGKRIITSRDNSPGRGLVSPEHNKLHVPNYMRPTISSSLGQNRRSNSSSSSKETLIRSSFKKPFSPCPRVNRSSSFNHEPSSRLVTSSPRKSKNKLLETSKRHFSKGHNRSSSLDPALSRTIGCIDDMSQTKNIEDHQGDHQLESSAQSHIIEGHCDPLLEDNAPVKVVDDQVLINRYDYDPDKVFDEVQAMMLEDYNCHNEINPEILEDNKKHNNVDTKSTNEIHPPRNDIDNSNEINLLIEEENKVLIEDVHLIVMDEDKVHLIEDDVQLGNHDASYDDEDCRVHDKEDIKCDENSREIANVKEDEQPYYCEKQNECHRVDVEYEKDGIVEVEDEKYAMSVHDDDVHFEYSYTNLDINEESKVSSSEEFNAKHQNQEQDHLNVSEAQENGRNQENQGMTSTDVTKEAIQFEVEKEFTTMNVQVNEPTIVTQVSQEQNETTTMNEQVKEPTIITQASQEQNETTATNDQVKDPTIITQASQEQNETKKASINKRFIINKKEPTIAYNDVIEETRSKLVQDRKNKVKALVGAFETVMSFDKR